jgi:hypothetical protein
VPPLATARSLLRAAREIIDTPIDESGAPLELNRTPQAPPRVTPATPVEHGFFAREVGDDATPAFGGFLDGVQESRVVTWLPAGLPLVLGVVGAVILTRGDDRRLVAWGMGARVRRALVLPRALIDPALWKSFEEKADVEDSSAPADARHPDALLACAVNRVETLRAAEERTLAEAWVQQEHRPLALDGGLSGLAAAARSDKAVGIVKSHRTLYVEVAEMPQLFALAAGSRTRVLSRTDQSSGAGLWTWYLRLHSALPSNPLHGLVRLEVCEGKGDAGLRADIVSRWVMAERTPIALPDARWDVMSYGIARCEAYLKRGLALRART